MKGKSSISSWQLAILLFISRTMQFFLAASSQGDRMQVSSILIVLPISLLATGAILIPAYFLLRCYENQTLFEIASNRWGKGSQILAVLFFVFAVGILVQTVSAFSYFLTSEVYALYEKMQENLVKEEVRHITKRLFHEIHCDALGYANVLMQQQSNYWMDNGENYKNILSDVRFSIEVDSHINQGGTAED